VSKSKRSQKSSIVVKNLTRNVKEKHLNEIFGTFGKIDKVDLILHPKHSEFSTGVCIIYYNTENSIKEAIHSMDEGQIDGAVIRVERQSY
ncbi:MAG: RNA-binding protein with serine-rich domain 1, partial [Paramarteilia canceri]